MTDSPDEIIAAVIRQAARVIEAVGPSSSGGIGEIAHLQPAIVQVLRERFGERTWPNAKIAIPNWKRVGHVDVVLRDGIDDSRATFAAELKSGKIDEALWDLLKMALLATRSVVDATYLITAATEKAWSNDCCRGLFADTTHSATALCELRYPSGRLVWDWMLEGGWDKYPDEVPLDIETRLTGAERLAFGGESWEIRALRVVSQTDTRVPFYGGWPNGLRPPNAKHPLLMS